MPELQRRHLGAALARWGTSGLAAGLLPTALWAQGAKPVSLGPKLRIVIPANTRTALDHTGRALGDGLVGVGVCDEIEYENIDGKGGSVALETYVKKYAADPNTLLLGGMALLSSTAAYKAAVDITRVQPVARLTSASLVVVVAKDSPLRSLTDLVAKLKSAPKQTVLGGGLLASEDHLLSSLLLRAVGQRLDDMAYTPFSANFQLIDALSQGKVAAAISGYGVFSEDLTSGRLQKDHPQHQVHARTGGRRRPDQLARGFYWRQRAQCAASRHGRRYARCNQLRAVGEDPEGVQLGLSLAEWCQLCQLCRS
jgi:putative tricarboxylic transport membrane protein